MIRLTSQPTPEATARLADLEQKRLAANARGESLPGAVAGGYRHPDVKTPLMVETHTKCAYCEALVTHVYFGDVEHILPKRSVPDRMFDYDNLTIACAVCNNRKGTYHDPRLPLLDPYQDDPEEHLLPLGPVLWHRPGHRAAEFTIRRIDLNRTELRERRLERLDSVARLADKYEAEPPGALKALLRQELLEQADADQEFSLFVRSYLRASYGVY